MTKLFGTDGIRGRADEAPLDASTLRQIGRALGRVLARDLAHPARLVVGSDTRESGPRVLAALVGGLHEEGASVRSAGVIPTPGISFLARSADFDAGIMISASHNAWPDNGIKVFSSAGTKLPDALEDQVETELGNLPSAPSAASHGSITLRHEPTLAGAYARWLIDRGRAAGGLSGMHVIADCANGAASAIAIDVLSQLGARAVALHAAPNGRNINDGCGSLHLGSLAQAVRDAGADAGVALDGDADRALFVTHDGQHVDGDHVLLIAAEALSQSGRLRGSAIVGTVMTNLGLEHALDERGLHLVRENVGDRNVLERMQRDGCNLGGEPSGHVIFLDEAPTGDGLMTAIQLLSAVRASGRTLADLASSLHRAPQVLRNVRVRARVPLEGVPGWTALLSRWTERFGSHGRVLVRYSGTEPLVRVMAEGADGSLVAECAEELATHLQGALGA